jgi:hypothetical protein
LHKRCRPFLSKTKNAETFHPAILAGASAAVASLRSLGGRRGRKRGKHLLRRQLDICYNHCRPTAGVCPRVWRRFAISSHCFDFACTASLPARKCLQGLSKGAGGPRLLPCPVQTQSVHRSSLCETHYFLVRNPRDERSPRRVRWWWGGRRFSVLRPFPVAGALGHGSGFGARIHGRRIAAFRGHSHALDSCE